MENINIYKFNVEDSIKKEEIKTIFANFQINLLNNNLWKIDNVNKKISKVFNSDQFISYSSYSSWIRKDKNMDAVINHIRIMKIIYQLSKILILRIQRIILIIFLIQIP